MVNFPVSPMTHEAWPSPDAPPGPLPRIEDLPVAEQGYQQEAVRAAFDSFYRHAAQLDASLRALEAVEIFRRDADALRNDLRALRALGVGGGFGETSWTADRYDAPRRDVPAVVFRLAAESALIVAVAVAPPPAWGPPLEPDEDTEPEALTIIAARDPWETDAPLDPTP